ncbi:MAG: hypothetical protein ACJAR2_003962 [Ilumatobacter sp.]|jgi:hypothetical protein
MATTAACSGSTATDGLSPTIEDTSNSALTAQQPSSTGVALVETTDITDVIATLTTAGRVDLQPTGNRVIEGAGTLTTPPSTLELPNDAVAQWILPAGNNTWIAVLDDGTALEVDGSAVPIRTQTVERSPPTVGAPISSNGQLESSGLGRELFSDPIPDARIVTDGSRLVALSGPTDRYPHGVLGDELEGSAIEVRVDNALSTPITLRAPDVFEALSAMLADVDDDGELDIVVTISNGTTGARVAAFDFDGALLAETDPIGRGNRWRNLLAVAPIGPDGTTEVIDIQTPHIGGILQFFRFDGHDKLERVAFTEPYSTHSIGSRNLDLGIVSDADGDGQLDVVLPTQDRQILAVVTRDDATPSGTREIFRFPLDATLTTNISAQQASSGAVGYALGTSDGRIIVWPAR